MILKSIFKFLFILNNKDSNMNEHYTINIQQTLNFFNFYFVINVISYYIKKNLKIFQITLSFLKAMLNDIRWNILKTFAS